MLILTGIDGLQEGGLSLGSFLQFLKEQSSDGIEIDGDTLDQLVDVGNVGLLKYSLQHVGITHHVSQHCF